LNKFKFNIVFLDLNLNGKSGYDVLKYVTAYSFHTIIVSAYPDKATEAFEYGVLDFIVKPLTEKRLSKALNRYYSTSNRNNKTEFLTFLKRGNLEIIQTEKIMYIKAIKHYSEVYLNDGNILFHDKSLNTLEAILPSYLIRTHKSYIVNLYFVKKLKAFTGSIYKIILNNGLTLPVGRTRVMMIKDKLINNSFNPK